MEPNDYYKLTQEVAVYSGASDLSPQEFSMEGIIYCTLGLNGEAGEVAEKIKKLLRDSNKIINHTNLEPILNELGDVLYYLTRLAIHLGFDLEYLMDVNASKLRSRMQRDKLHGSGDDR